MDFLEKNLEDIIFETENKYLQERGLPIMGAKKRQLLIGNYGIADLVTIQRMPKYGTVMIRIYELKKDEINWQTFHQAVRYLKGIKQYFEKYDHFEEYNIDYELILVGKKIKENCDFVYISDIGYSTKIYTYSYAFDGIKFERHMGYHLTNEGF